MTPGNESAAPSKHTTRRRALQIVAAAVLIPTVGYLSRQGRPLETSTWEGVSLGGPASITIAHNDAETALRTVYKLRTEIERLELIFSLYRHDSEIAQINRIGRSDAASNDMMRVLEHGLQLAQASAGAFDPTVQPLWRLYADHFRRHPDAKSDPDRAAVAAALTVVDHSGVDISGRKIRFARSGMALTLNGLAQGYITDRVADILFNEGFEQALINVGETRAVGQAADGHPWSVGIKNPRNPIAVDRVLGLANLALSVSGGYGTPIGKAGSHHIFDPRTGLSAQKMLDSVVTAPNAMIADGLSTAIYVAGEALGKQLIAAAPGASATITRLDGAVVAL